jgi:hypothetical protein
VPVVRGENYAARVRLAGEPAAGQGDAAREEEGMKQDEMVRSMEATCEAFTALGRAMAEAAGIFYRNYAKVVIESFRAAFPVKRILVCGTPPLFALYRIEFCHVSVYSLECPEGELQWFPSWRFWEGWSWDPAEE